MSKFSHKQKKEEFPFLVGRDGYGCLYCPDPFTDTNKPEFDHLNNNDKDNRPENHALVHHSCNVKKKYSPELQIIAAEKLKENECSTFACEGNLADTGTTEQLSSQQAISKINRSMAEQWIVEHTLMEKEVMLKDAVNAIVNLCNDNNGTGSQSAIYRYIDSLSNPYNGKYTLSSNLKGKTIIRRRTEN